MKINLGLAEQRIVGGCLMSDEIAEYACTLIRSSDFSSPALKAMFSVVEHCRSKGLESSDLDVFCEVASSMGVTGLIGDASALNLVASEAGTKSNLPKFAEVVKREGLRKRSRQAVSEFMQVIDSGCPTEIVNDLISNLTNHRELSVDLKGVGVKDALKEAWDAKNMDEEYLSFGMFPIDRRFNGGVSPTSFTIVGASPSAGKSAFAMNIVANGKLGNRPAKCLLLSMEMGCDELIDRLTACVSGVPITTCRALRTGMAYDGAGRMGQLEFKKISDKYGPAVFGAVNKIKESGHIMRYHGLLTVADFRALVSLHADEIDYIVLDYIQQIKPDGNQTEIEKTNEISWTCKDIAMKYKKPVIALSQFNRTGYADNAKPSMSSLRQSGQLEQDADNVILLWRERKADVVAEDLEVNVVKNRNGGVGVSIMEFQLTKGKIDIPMYPGMG